jgi:hypothetical protein
MRSFSSSGKESDSPAVRKRAMSEGMKIPLCGPRYESTQRSAALLGFLAFPESLDIGAMGTDGEMEEKHEARNPKF